MGKFIRPAASDKYSDLAWEVHELVDAEDETLVAEDGDETIHGVISVKRATLAGMDRKVREHVLKEVCADLVLEMVRQSAGLND